MEEKTGSLQMGAEYSKLATVQKKYNIRAAELLDNEIMSQFKEAPELFTSSDVYRIADLGCADGINSLPLLQTIVERIRSINPSKEISVYLNDTPDCDLTKAMNNVRNALSKSYDKLYVFATSKSFYEPLFPPNRMDLIYCVTSVHMMSKPAPAVHDNWIFYMSDDCIDLSENGKKWIELGEQDWESFLRYREVELKPKGRLYVGTHTINKEGTEQSKYAIQISKNSKDVLRRMLKKYGWESYEQDLTISIISRKEENYKKPFADKKTNLCWIMSEIREHKDPIYEKMKVDPAAAKETYKALVKTYFGGKFQAVLEGKKESKVKIDEFLQELFEKYAEESVEIMKEFKEDYVGSSIAMIMKKP